MTTADRERDGDGPRNRSPWPIVVVIVMLGLFMFLIAFPAVKEFHSEREDGIVYGDDRFVFVTQEVPDYGTCTFALYESAGEVVRGIALVGCNGEVATGP